MSTPSSPVSISAAQQSARKKWRLLFLLPAGYVIFVAAIFSAALYSMHAQQTPPAPKPKNAPPASADIATELRDTLGELKSNVAVEQDYLDKRAAQLDKRADDLEHLIVEMTLGSSIYTFLLGLFAYFSLKTIKADAEADLAKIEGLLDDFKKNEFADFRKNLQDRASSELERARAEFDTFRAEVRNDIPELYGMARSLGVLLDRIRRQIDMSHNWTLRESYEAMSDEERQTVLVAEMTVAGFDYFGLPASKRFRAVAGEIYLELANFYAARSRMVGADNAFNQADMHRAFIYMDRACLTDPTNPRTFSQRAALTLVHVPKVGDSPTKEQLEKAEADLGQCLSLKPNDARSLYNMAWISRRRGKLDRAIEFLTKIVDLKDKLDADDRGRRMIDTFTNRACYCALSLGQLPPNAAQVPEIQAKTDSILADCKAACEEGKSFNLKDYCIKGFAREFGAGGDLEAVKQLLSAQAVADVIACT